MKQAVLMLGLAYLGPWANAQLAEISGVTSGSCTLLWLNDNVRACCAETGQCQSSSCTVFGFKNSARANCPIETKCTQWNCQYAVPGCKAANSNVHCWGNVTCTDGTKTCPNYGEICLGDGSSKNFKVCPDPPLPVCTTPECPVCKECLVPDSYLSPVTKQCECLPGLIRNPADVTQPIVACDKPVTNPCTNATRYTRTITVDESAQNLMLWKPGPEVCKGKGKGCKKRVDQDVGEFRVDYDESSKTFSLIFAITGKAAEWGYPTSFIRFKKVWPRLRMKQPVQWDTKWLREYVDASSNATYVRFDGIPVPDFLCDTPGVKNLKLMMQLQYWIPNNGVKLDPATGLPRDLTAMHYKAAHGYILDGLTRTGRQRHEFIIPVTCGATVIGVPGCDCDPACTGLNEICVVDNGGTLTCECKPGFDRNNMDECVADSCSGLEPYCPDNSYCLERGEGNGPICKCNPGFHEAAAEEDGSLICVRKCVLNNATPLKIVGAGLGGKVQLIINDLSPPDAVQYKLLYTAPGGSLIKSARHFLGNSLPDKHIPALFRDQYALLTATGSVTYPADGSWLVMDPIDCSPGADNVRYISTSVGIISSGTGKRAWAKGKKTDDANVQDFEFRIQCHGKCPIVANCDLCGNNAECVWEHGKPDANKYTCKCNPGYKPDPANPAVDCININECIEYTYANGAPVLPCGTGGTCTDTQGGYTCACGSGTGWNGDNACVKGAVSYSASEGTAATATTTEGTSAAECPAPAWAWIVVGVLTASIAVASTLVVVQCVVYRRNGSLMRSERRDIQESTGQVHHGRYGDN